MARRSQTAKSTKNDLPPRQAGGATVGYEAKLGQMADALRGSMDAAEYKHVVLGRHGHELPGLLHRAGLPSSPRGCAAFAQAAIGPGMAI